MTKRIKLKMLLILAPLCLITLIISSFITVKVKAETDNRSLIADYLNPVFEISLNDGSNNLFESGINRKDINDSIYNESSSSTYSLYDRFGSNISFIPYFGETKIQIGLIDKLYTLFCDNIDDWDLSLDDLKKFFKGVDAISNNCVYENRPNILTGDMLKNGNKDPRVSAYHGISYVGGDAYLGNIPLQISIFITSFVAWISGSGLFNIVNNLFIKLSKTKLMELVSVIVTFLMPLVIAVALIILISRIVKVLKGTGSLTIKKIATDMISFVLSLGLIYSLIGNPMYFSGIYKNIITIMDNTFDEALSNNSNEVVKSDDLTNVRAATLWYVSVFNPWCEGTFGDKYENLYTQFSETGNKMKQDHDIVSVNWGDGSKRYNSADLTGDISIPIGNGESIKNWAALAYSCQSIYHIDAVEGAVNAGVSRDNSLDWPKGTFTPYNNNIYVDNFRWLDAMLNISPEYKSAKNISMNYSNSNKYDEHFINAGNKSLFLSIMLIPIMILSFRRLKSILLLVTSGFRLMYYSAMNFILQDDYNILKNFKKTLIPIYDYFWWSMTIFLSISLYKNLVGQNYLVNIVYLVLTIYLNVMKPIRTPYQVKAIARKAKEKISDAKDSLTKKRK